MRYLALLLALCFGLLGADPIYVSTSGNNTTGDGTIGLPYRTIKKGIDMLSAGGTLILRGGNYEEASIDWPIAKNGTSDAERTIVQSYAGERAVFYPTTHNKHGINSANTTTGMRNVTFDGWTIDFSRKDIEAGGYSSYANIKILWCTNITFTNMYFQNNTNGMLTQIYTGTSNPLGPGGNILVSSCLFTNVRRKTLLDGHVFDQVHPLYWNSMRDVVIENSTFVDGENWGIHFYGGNIVTNVTIRNNWIERFNGGMYLNVRNGEVYNNVLTSITNLGIGRRSYSTRYANNTVYTAVAAGSGSYGIHAYGYGDTFINNIVWGNWSTGIRSDGTGTFYMTNNLARNWTITAGTVNHSGNLIGTGYDPIFSDASGGDFRVATNSPASAAGIDMSSVFTTDYYGTNRTVWDIGAIAVGSDAGGEDPDPPDPVYPIVSVSQTGDAFEINSTTSTFVVSRAGSSDGNLNVVFAMTGTASSNVNYTLSHSSPVTINNAEWTQTITLTPVDLETVGTLDATLTIQPDAAYTVAANSNATIVIYGSGSGESGFKRTYGGAGVKGGRGRL